MRIYINTKLMTLMIALLYLLVVTIPTSKGDLLRIPIKRKQANDSDTFTTKHLKNLPHFQ